MTSEPVAQRAAWITWERQRRNEGVARGLSVPLIEVLFRGSMMQRYVRASRATIRAVRRVRPEILFVQNPSLVLALGAVLWGRARGVPVIVDAHNSGLQPFDGTSRVLNACAAVVMRLASLTIVSNNGLIETVQKHGGRAFVLPDPIPELPPGNPPQALNGTHRVMFICSYATDEPYIEVIEAARRLDPSTVIYITGNPKEEAQHLRDLAPANVVFTGFLAEADFIGLMHACDVVMDLTTRADCLVCGAYEGVAAGKPLVLSDSKSTREYFSRGAVYTDNSTAGIAASVRSALEQRARLAAQVVELRDELLESWNSRRMELRKLLRDLAQQPASELD